MAAKREIITWLARKFKGVDKRDTFVDGDFYVATECKNLDMEDSGKICLRKGTRSVFRTTDTGAGSGSDGRYLFGHSYTYFDTDDGSTQKELIALQGKDGNAPQLYLLREVTMTLTYVGAGTTKTFNLTRTDSGWRAQVTVDGSDIFDTTYATYGASPDTVETLRAALHAHADLTCTFSSTPSPSTRSPVAVLGVQINKSLSSAQTFTFWEAVEIDGATLPQPSPDFLDADFLPPTFHNNSNVCLFAYGDYPYVYDGLRVYRLGLPQATINGVADTGSGSTFNQNEEYIYKLIYKRVDYRGNIIEGEDSDDSLDVATHTVSAASSNISVTINNLQTAAFLPRGAIANGAQTGVTSITVDSGHTIETGDVIYFYDGATSEYVTRTVTGTTSTTISFSGSVNVADNAVISNNLRIQIWRTKNQGLEFFLVAEIPNDALNATQVYVDSTADDDLGATFTEQVRKHNLPPKTRYLTEHQGLVIFAGDPENPNTVSFALPDAFYAVPTASNSFDIKESSKGPVTGVISDTDNMLAVFKTNSYTNIVGDLDGLNFKPISKSAFGCVAHATIQKLDEVIVGLSTIGPFSLQGGEYSLALGAPLRTEFENEDYTQVSGTAITSTQQNLRVLKRASAIHDPRTQRYLLFAGFEGGTPGTSRTTIDSLTRNDTFVYDYRRGHWREYNYPDQVQPSGGFFIHDNELYFNSLETGDADFTKELRDETQYDYADDDNAISALLSLQYLDFGNPSTFFKLLFFKLLRYLGGDELVNTGFTLQLSAYKNDETSSYVSFDCEFTATMHEKAFKFPAGKVRRVQFDFENETNREEKFEFDGFQIELCNPYAKKLADAKET